MLEREKIRCQQQRPALKIGLLLPHWTGAADGQTPGWAEIRALAQQAEAMGFASLWINDELFWKADAGASVASWECLSVLSALAMATSRVEIGSLVLSTGYRNPALLAQIACTIDEISQGRFVLGVGTGDIERIHRAYGFAWERRYGRFAEALQILHGLLHTGAVDFCGTHYQIREVELPLRGPRPAGPPILVGAEAPGPRLLGLIAQYADQWNYWLGEGSEALQTLAGLRTALEENCHVHRRPPATLEHTLTVGVTLPGHQACYGPIRYPQGLTGTPAQIAEGLLAMARQGFSQIFVYLTPCTLAGLEAFAPVLEIVRREAAQRTVLLKDAAKVEGKASRENR
ncbi:MAG TPA: LLM class flavin-dependent oxidoreductase [Ktedonobacteraceae bacterium]|nr:LLM class flavin-dependent oxidoreductase [Ktedonobacteraceae bacterium]